MITTRIYTRGFSLVETLVAVLILLIAVVAPLTIVTRSAQSSAFAIEQATATFLAQEGLESVQQIRDELYLAYFERLAARSNIGLTPQQEANLITALDSFADNGNLAPLNNPPNFTSDDAVLVPWHLFTQQTSSANSGLLSKCFYSSGCEMGPAIANELDILNQTTWPQQCAGTVCDLEFDTSQGATTRFMHSAGLGGETTKYNRVIRFETTASDREVRVISTVEWTTGELFAVSRVVTETAVFNVYDLP